MPSLKFSQFLYIFVYSPVKVYSYAGIKSVVKLKVQQLHYISLYLRTALPSGL